MRKTKKPIALVLAMVFVVAFMAMNVSAATTRAACPQCGGASYDYSYSFVRSQNPYYVSSCKYYTSSHTHDRGTYKLTTKCRTCTYSTTTTLWSGERCLLNGKQV